MPRYFTGSDTMKQNGRVLETKIIKESFWYRTLERGPRKPMKGSRGLPKGSLYKLTQNASQKVSEFST